MIALLALLATAPMQAPLAGPVHMANVAESHWKAPASTAFEASGAHGLAADAHRLGCLRDCAEIAEASRAAARRYRLDARLFIALARAESRFERRAVSKRGCIGVWQVAPYHFAPGADPFTPGVNAMAAGAVLAAGKKRCRGSVIGMLSRYGGFGTCAASRLSRKVLRLWARLNTEGNS